MPNSLSNPSLSSYKMRRASTAFASYLQAGTTSASLTTFAHSTPSSHAPNRSPSATTSSRPSRSHHPQQRSPLLPRTRKSCSSSISPPPNAPRYFWALAPLHCYIHQPMSTLVLCPWRQWHVEYQYWLVTRVDRQRVSSLPRLQNARGGWRSLMR